MPSITAVGTARPTSASHAIAGRMYRKTSTGNGRKTTTPTTKAVTSRRRSTGRPATIAEAPTYEAVTSGTPTARLTISWLRPSSAGSNAPKIPIGTPSANEAQKRRPYRRSASATTCPTVRVSGGSGGGSGSWGFLATALR